MATKIRRKTDNAENLTEDKIGRIKPPAIGRLYVYDANPALAVCVTSAGTKTFYFAKRVNGEYKRSPIGRVGAVSLADARNAVARMLGEAVVKGIDPVQQKREDRQQQFRENLTLRNLWTAYLENHAKKHKRSWRDDEERYNRHLAAWKDKPLDDIDQAAVARLHTKVGAKGKYEANRVLTLLATMFSKGASEIKFDGPNPAKGIDKFHEEKRERYLYGDEMPKFFAALAELRIASRVAADALEFCLWTGARSGNVKSAALGRYQHGTGDVDDSRRQPQEQEARHHRLDPAGAGGPRAPEA